MVLKRALADRVVLAAAFCVVLFGATLVAAIPIYVNAVGQSGLRERLARAPVTEANLQATAPSASGREFRALDAQVTRLARGTFAAAGGAALYRSGESEPFAAAGRTVVFGFFDGIRDHARLVAGRWPREGEVAVPAPAAAQLRLEVGDEVDARSRLTGGPRVTARVAGIYRVERPSSVYWWEEPLATTGSDGGELGPLVTTRREFLSLGLQGGAALAFRARLRLADDRPGGRPAPCARPPARAAERGPKRRGPDRPRHRAPRDPRRRRPLAPCGAGGCPRPVDPGRAARAVRPPLHDCAAARSAPRRD